MTKANDMSSETSQFLVSHGLLIVFGVVLLEQLGLPIPAFPWLMAAGALAAAGHFGLPGGLALTVLACLLADALWYYLGRRRGSRVLGLLCRVSLEPDSCVRRTLDVFTRYGWQGIVVAKFVPGMSTVTPPLAGMTGLRAGRFLVLDGLGSLLYCGVFLLLGYFFSSEVAQIGAAITRLSGEALKGLVLFTLLYVAFKWWQRRRLLRELRTARITADELRGKLDAGERPVILDLRSRAELELDPTVITGAIHLAVEDIARRHHDLPRDRDIVIYCSCPNEATSARVALQLHRRGFTRVRPLLGGVDAWRKNHYPMEEWTVTVVTAAGGPIPAAGSVQSEGRAQSGNSSTPGDPI